eukprot:9471571-Pyramimonas_sp.AAC.2
MRSEDLRGIVGKPSLKQKRTSVLETVPEERGMVVHRVELLFELLEDVHLGHGFLGGLARAARE